MSSIMIPARIQGTPAGRSEARWGGGLQPARSAIRCSFTPGRAGSRSGPMVWARRRALFSPFVNSTQGVKFLAVDIGVEIGLGIDSRVVAESENCWGRWFLGAGRRVVVPGPVLPRWHAAHPLRLSSGTRECPPGSLYSKAVSVKWLAGSGSAPPGWVWEGGVDGRTGVRPALAEAYTCLRERSWWQNYGDSSPMAQNDKFKRGWMTRGWMEGLPRVLRLRPAWAGLRSG